MSCIYFIPLPYSTAHHLPLFWRSLSLSLPSLSTKSNIKKQTPHPLLPHQTRPSSSNDSSLPPPALDFTSCRTHLLNEVYKEVGRWRSKSRSLTCRGELELFCLIYSPLPLSSSFVGRSRGGIRSFFCGGGGVTFSKVVLSPSSFAHLLLLRSPPTFSVEQKWPEEGRWVEFPYSSALERGGHLL